MSRVLLINPPYDTRIIRRYVCSYNAPNFLFPPLELMYLSAQARLVEGCETRLLDAIALGLTADEVVSLAREFDPDVVVAIMAIEYFDNDLDFVGRVKKELPRAQVGSFGYLPSKFTGETLRESGSDFVLVGEPDLTFRAVVESVAAGAGLPDVEGVARLEGGDVVRDGYQRIESLDDLPFADQSAIDHSLYGEPFFGRPYTTFQSSRGCPFPCAYCVRTYGRKLALASADHVIGEVKDAVERIGIRYFRFMDDTFTVSRKRVFSICEGLSPLRRKISWSCLTRPNTIDGEVAAALKDAGCKRVYVGIESGSQKVIDYLQRGYRLDAVMGNLEEVRRSGLEMVGWFIVGSPVEEREDFEASLRLARDLRLEFVAVSTLAPYPETELFEREKDNIEFNLLPYRCSFNDTDGGRREAEFYRRFYMRPAYIAGKAGHLVKHPAELARSAREFARYVVASRRDPHRKDLL